jgi:hypothetical protein
MLEPSPNQTCRFAEIRPDAVVGIVLNVNAMNIAQNLSLWLSLVRSTEGAGVKVEVPAALQSRHSDTSQELLGKFSVINSLQDAGKSQEWDGGEYCGRGDNMGEELTEDLQVVWATGRGSGEGAVVGK